jgi:hypothetical protein
MTTLKAFTPTTRENWMSLPETDRNILSMYNFDVTEGLEVQRMLMRQAKVDPAQTESCARALARYIKSYKSGMLLVAYYNLFDRIDLDHFRHANDAVKQAEALAESCGMPPMFVYPIGPVAKIPQPPR